MNTSTTKETGEGTIHYFYNEADQLIREEGPGGERTFRYDRRGNLTAIRQGEELVRQYLYDETSRMAAASDGIHSSWYQYSGVGNRTGILEYAVAPPGPGNLFLPEAVPAGVPSKRTEYITDLTRPYHNLLQRMETAEGKETIQSYTWDTNAVFLREGECVSAYLQDELGSPVRLTELRSGRQTLYGYDEFGADLFGNQGETQPFGYTGYQPDRTAGTSYAQAREYLPWAGRFTGRDLIKGFAELPFTLNEYGYCWNNPLILVDRNGALPEWLEDIGKWVYENKETIKDVIVGGTIIIGTVVILSDVAVAAGLAPETGILGTVGGYSGIAAAVLAGGLSAGGINELTGSGSFDNGYIGGAINSSLVFSLVPKVLNPHQANALGGGAGSFVTDLLNYIDDPDAELEDFLENRYNWYFSAVFQTGIGGSLDKLSSSVRLGTSTGKGWDKIAGIVWDAYKTVYAMGGSIMTAGLVNILNSPSVS